MKKIKSSPDLIRRVRRITFVRLVRHFGWIIGKSSFILGILMTFILVFFFGFDFRNSFSGSFLAFAVFISMLMPYKRAWKNCYVMTCQDEGLWDEADRAETEEAGSGLQDILEGKAPQGPLKLSSLILMKITGILVYKGDVRQSVRLSEYLIRQIQAASEADIEGKMKNNPLVPWLERFPNETEPIDYAAGISSEEGGLAAKYLSLGRYKEGIALARKRMEFVRSRKIEDRGSVFFVNLLLADAFLDLHNVDEAWKYIEELGKIVEASTKSENENPTVEKSKGLPWWLQIDTAYYLMLLGRFKALKGEPDSEQTLKRAEEIMRSEEYQQEMKLLYPEILFNLALAAIQHGDFSNGEKYAREALAYFEEKTRFEGSRYWAAKGALGYSRLKQGAAGDFSGEFEVILNALKDSLEEGHLEIASCRTYHAESLIRDGKTEPARKALEKALKTRKSNFPPGDPQIREVQKLLDALPVPD